MGIPVSKHSRFSCRKAECNDGTPYLPQFNVTPQRRYFKFVSYDRSDVQCGSGRAEVTLENLVLFSHIHSETIPLDHIRRYGVDMRNCFFFDTGQRCPSGVARHNLWMEKADEMLIEFDHTLAWRRQKRILKEQEDAKNHCDLLEPMSSSLMQRRAAAMNAYVTEPVTERRRRNRRRRERDLLATSSDTDSRSDMDHRNTTTTAAAADASTTTTTTTMPAPAATGSRHSSPKSGSPASNEPVEVLARQGAKAPSPSKSSAHRIRLNGESSGESTSSRHRSHRPPRARSRHSNSYKPATGMSTHFELQYAADMHAHSLSLDTLDMSSSSDVGATEDGSTTDMYRSTSTSTNEIDSLSGRSQSTVHLDVPYGGSSSVLSASPASTGTIVPSSSSSPCRSAAVALKSDSVTESDSDKTLCAGSPSSTESKFSAPIATSSSSASGGRTDAIQGTSSGADSSGSSTTCSPEHIDGASSADERDDGTGFSPYLEASDCDDCSSRHPTWHSSAVTLCSSAATLRDGAAFEMCEETASPPMTGDSPPPLPTACRHAPVRATTTAFSLGSSEESLDSAAAATLCAHCAACAQRASTDEVTSFSNTS